MHRLLTVREHVAVLGACLSVILAVPASGVAQIANPAEPPPTAGAAPSGSTGADADSSGEAINVQRPRGEVLRYPLAPIDPAQVPPPAAILPRETVPVPDRWRIMEALGMQQNSLDPYNQNVWKADKPFPGFSGWGDDWFLNVGAISDFDIEARRLPAPTGGQTSSRPGSYNVFGRGASSTFSQNVILSASVIKGDTTFKPPDFEFRFVPVANFNVSHASEVSELGANPMVGTTRQDAFVGIQEAFADVHLRNVSEHYDFDSMRVGIQPFTSDFRGFIFQDSAFGVRLFGTRDNNLWQYNLALLQRLEKDTNSGLNDVGRPFRRDETFIANLYRQDFPVPGHTTQLTVMHNINHDDNTPYYDSNGFLQRPAVIGDGRPHHYAVTYFGLNGDGHFGAWNLTSSFYAVTGHDSDAPIAQKPQQVEAGFMALELSQDMDWIRVRGSLVGATGDRDPYDGKSTGFDAILENPQIAGADSSFWIRQAIPLIGGGNIELSGRNGLLPSLRSSKDDGQSNFVNPGLILYGIGADFDVTPQLRVLTNLSHLRFANVSSLEVLRNQGGLSEQIGLDASVGVQYRPFQTQNVVLTASVASLLPSQGFRQLYDSSQLGRPYSVLFNLLLNY